ncbi:MAG TPA: hypothetical protein VGQ87_02125 [Patescibacteria group bacterium]|jgi:ZIP family zinc transporter|nr:hypothetical protein [Patescibacteria group bacterium]
METKTKFNIVISLAAGIFIGGVIFDALPEASETLGITRALVYIIIGYVIWWLTKILLNQLKKPALPWLTGMALWFHSILEGAATGLAFGVSSTFGFFMLIAMTLHLLPEFFGAVALMKGAGSTVRNSLFATFIGFILLYLSFVFTYWLLPNFDGGLQIAVALSGGAFLYVGLVSFWKRKSLLNFLSLIAGVVIIFLQSRFLGL